MLGFPYWANIVPMQWPYIGPMSKLHWAYVGCQCWPIIAANMGQYWTNIGLLPGQLSSHLYQSTYKIWKQSNKDFLSYRVNDEVSADTA